MKYLVFHKGITETLAYFSACIAAELEKLGHQVLRFEVADGTTELPQLVQFLKQGGVTLITFNFHGIQQEAIFYDAKGRLLWDVYQVRCVNIVADHPLYYWKRFATLPKYYVQLCIDHDHEAYMRRFYPVIRLLPTMPLAGSTPAEAELAGVGRGNPAQNTFCKKCVPKCLQDRTFDIVFAGNYKPPREFDELITRNGPEYERFYRAILDDFFAHPEQGLNTVFETHIQKNMGNLSDQEMTQAFHYLMFLDMYVRFHYRGEVVRLLTEAGLPVHMYGLGWERLATKRPELLYCHGSVDTTECLNAFAEAKLSLNVMPWFKKGAHDRIYSSMLCGAVSVTDTSEYLIRRFRNKEQLVFYSLEELENVPELVKELLADEEKMQQIADHGYAFAKKHLTWQQFVADLLGCLENMDSGCKNGE